MPKNQTAAAASSSAPRLAIVVLAAGLLAAAAYAIHLRGRVDELERQVAAASRRVDAPPPAKAPAAAVAPVAVAPADLFTTGQRDAALEVLRAEVDPNRKAWFQIQQNNAETGSVAAALKALFEDAGWPTETVRAPYPLKAGVFLLAGDTEPPAFVTTANAGLAAGGIEVQFLTGYREFVAERKQTNANWVGPELKADQAFSIVIGSRPVKAGG